MEQLLKDYLHSLKIEKNLSDNTIASYKIDLNAFLNFIQEKNIKDFSEVNTGHIRSFFKYLLNNLELSARSSSRYYSSLRGFFGYLSKNEYILSDPVERVDPPKLEKNLPEALTVEEIDKILDCPDTNDKFGLRDKAILEMLYACGLRVSELINLKTSDLFFDEELIRVFGKGSKERLVPIGRSAIEWTTKYLGEARPLLAKKLKSHNFIFLNTRGTKFSRMGIWKIVSFYTKAAGIEKEVHPHTFRHSFATHLINGGADLRAVQEMLGHADISTTQIYTHIDKDFIRQVHRDFHPRG